MADPVVIVDYDPRWPAMFREGQEAILGAIGPYVVAVEHVGSTAVPGLGAKPVIDILVGIGSLNEASACIGPLEALGYRYVPEFEAEFPERRYFDKGRPHACHVHMVEVTSEFWRRHLLFRDYLRARPCVARDYDRLKRALAQKFRDDREGYTRAKTSFIEGVVAKARAAGSH